MRKATNRPAAASGAAAVSDRTAGSGVGPAVVLVAPQLGENIGAAARAMANFCLSDLRLVAPRDGWPNEAARANASGADWVIDAARLFDTTRQAVAELNYVLATTARGRGMTKPILTPEDAVAEMRDRIADGQACGVLFGHERNGLCNDDVALADAILIAPVNPSFASLNLAQAVLLVAYEWRKQSGAVALGRGTALERPALPGLRMRKSRPAERAEMIGFLEHLERELDAAGFLRPPEKRPSMVRNIRNIFMRLGATEQEVKTLRGIVSALARGKKARPERS